MSLSPPAGRLLSFYTGGTTLPTKDLCQLQTALQALGYANYADYRESVYWKRTRRRFLNTEPRCYVCASAVVEMHHVTYVRLGRERLSDLVGLCPKHHLAAHELIASRPGTPLRWAHRLLKAPKDGYHKRTIGPDPNTPEGRKAARDAWMRRDAAYEHAKAYRNSLPR